MELSISRKLKELLGEEYKVKRSCYEDGPPCRTMILRKGPWYWPFAKEVAWMVNEEFQTDDRELAEQVELSCICNGVTLVEP